MIEIYQEQTIFKKKKKKKKRKRLDAINLPFGLSKKEKPTRIFDLI